jgi:glycosyltransferase involved in cell wall biosynthesis
VGRIVLRVVTRLNRGGPLRQLGGLVPALRAEGWDGPVLVGRAPEGEPDGTADLEAVHDAVVRVPALGRGLSPAEDARALAAVLGWIRRVRPDVVHTHMGKAGALGRLAARLARVPAVHTLHGHHFHAPRPLGALAASAERALGRATDALVCLTPRQRRDVVRRGIVPASCAHVIAPGLDVEGFRAQADGGASGRIRDLFGARDRPLFLWAGRFVAVKDPLLLVEAVARSARRFLVAMIGAGPLAGAVRDRVRELGLQEVVRCPGPIDRPAPWIAAADLLVLTSRSEGAPLAVLEAKALGRPALVTTVGGVPDLVTHDGDGWWVPPGRADAFAVALDRLAADPARLARLGAAARAGAERYRHDRLARETARLYETLAARGGRRRGRPRSSRERRGLR